MAEGLVIPFSMPLFIRIVRTIASPFGV